MTSSISPTCPRFVSFRFGVPALNQPCLFQRRLRKSSGAGELRATEKDLFPVDCPGRSSACDEGGDVSGSFRVLRQPGMVKLPGAGEY